MPLLVYAKLIILCPKTGINLKFLFFVDFLKFKRSLYQVIALLPIFNVFLLCVNVVSLPEPMAQVS